MSLKHFLTAALIAVLLFSTAVGLQISTVKGVLSTPTVIIQSPQNMTYSTDTTAVFILANCPNSGVRSIKFSLDEREEIIVYSNFHPERTNDIIRLDHNATGTAELTGLSDGTHRLEATAEEWFTEFVVFTFVYFTIDTTGPDISVLSPENKTYNTTDISLNFAVNESGSQIKYSLDGLENVTSSGNTTLSGLHEGPHSLVIYAEDTAGNTGVSERVYFNIETGSPIEHVYAVVAVTAVVAAIVGYLFLQHKKRVDKK